MNKQEKIKKVMREFKNGTLRSSDGKKVTSRKQALAIAMSESEDYAEKADLISAIRIDSVREAEEILKAAGTEGDLFEKAHYVGEIHPNGKWVWTEYKPGKFDWRGIKGGAKGGGGKTTTTPAPRKASNNGNGKSDFSALDSAQTQKNVNDFWSRILTTDNGHGGINLAGKLLDSMKERGYISLDGGITARGITTYNFKNKDADKNITIVPYQDGLVIKTKDKKETLKVSDFKNVSELKKKFDETVLKMAGKEAKSTKSTKKTLPDKIVEIHNDLDEKYGEDIKPFVYTSNGVSDLNKNGKKGFATWIGFKHKVRGRQPVDKTKMKNFVRNTAIKQFLQEVNAKTGKKFSEDDVKIDDYWDTTDMFRIYV